MQFYGSFIDLPAHPMAASTSFFDLLLHTAGCRRHAGQAINFDTAAPSSAAECGANDSTANSDRLNVGAETPDNESRSTEQMRLSVSISRTLNRKLKLLAHDQEMTVSALMLELIKAEAHKYEVTGA